MSKDNDDSDNDKYNLAKHKHKTIASSNGWKLAALTREANKGSDSLIEETAGPVMFFPLMTIQTPLITINISKNGDQEKILNVQIH